MGSPALLRERMSTTGGSMQDATERLSATSGVAADAPGGDFAGFRILKPLGAGGMGQVFLAEQSVPVVRRVALKLMRAAVESNFGLSKLKRN